jgi:hypothetical protein
MRRADTLRRYPVVGGVAAWRVPLLTVLVASCALSLKAWDFAVSVAVLGYIAHELWRNVVLESSAVGLTRGFLLKGSFLGRTTVLPWPAIEEVHTDWCRPGDDLALETTVRGRDGTTLYLSTAMGLGPYWACLADVVHHAPRAVPSGLTEELLADGPPGWRHGLSSTATAGALALVLVALVGVYYVWAQGRGSLARYIEETAGQPEGEDGGISGALSIERTLSDGGKP